MTDDLAAAVEALAARVSALPEGRRIVAIAGAPGSGKSTLAEALAAALPGAAVLPMDGYHYDDALLEARGLRPRKGAPETFDVGGLAHIIDRLRANDEDEVVVPVFDRSIEVSRGSARPIPRSVRTIVVEGNWLLLDRDPWRMLRPRFDLTVKLDVPFETLRARLRERWVGYGLDEAAIAEKLDGNDLPNARLASEGSGPADLTVRGGAVVA
ncbi:MAG: nucleoside/nucleotide kinase family protein [Pseudomonadota bacterium]